MKINDMGTARAATSYGVQRRGEHPAAAAAPGATPASSVARSDRATLSPEAQALLRGQQTGDAEGRAALVEHLRRQVQDGTYQVDEQALARRIAQRLRAGSLVDG